MTMTEEDIETETDATWRLACATAIAELPSMGPVRLSKAFEDSEPDEVWDRLGGGDLVPGAMTGMAAGSIGRMQTRWQRLIRDIDPLDVLERYRAADVNVWTPSVEYPTRLVEDPNRPEVLFYRGDAELLGLPTVAIIGTRHCSAVGLEVARRFGSELTEAGVSVVSGLAIGIDGAAHRGALETHSGVAPIAVVGNGLARPYPQRHASMWNDIGKKGLIISEAPLDAIPEPWRFPARNRILAGIADIVLVVESHDTGGSMLTVKEANNRGVLVMAVPGSVTNPASKGNNALLREGAFVATDAEDVLILLNLMYPGLYGTPPIGDDEPSWPEDITDREVLEAIAGDPASTDDVLERTNFSLGTVAVSLARLEQSGWIMSTDGLWIRCN